MILRSRGKTASLQPGLQQLVLQPPALQHPPMGVPPGVPWQVQLAPPVQDEEGIDPRDPREIRLILGQYPWIS